MTLEHDLTGLAKLATVLVVLTMVGDLAYLASAFDMISFIDRMSDGTIAPDQIDAMANAVDARGRIVAIGYLGIYALCVIVSAIWIYRASQNAGQLQPFTGRITPGWAVGWFFVPILSLWKPFGAMRETWNTSHDPLGDPNRAAPGLMKVWWALWVIVSIINNLSFRMWMRADTAETIRASSVLDAVIVPFSLVASVLFILVIRRITAAQAHVAIPQNSPPLAGVSL